MCCCCVLSFTNLTAPTDRAHTAAPRCTCSCNPVCTPACVNGGACVGQNSCDCEGTGFTGPTCAVQPTPPTLLAEWDFDDCEDAPPNSRGVDPGSVVAVFGKQATLERCGGDDGGGGCVASFSVADCCTDGWGGCNGAAWNGSIPWCDDPAAGSVITLRHQAAAPWLTSAPDLLAFDAFTSFSVSAWVRHDGLHEGFTVTGRLWDWEQALLMVSHDGHGEPARHVALRYFALPCNAHAATRTRLTDARTAAHIRALQPSLVSGWFARRMTDPANGPWTTKGSV